MTDDKQGFHLDWRVAFGLVVTTVWIGMGLTYLLAMVGWGNFVHLPTADIGSFLEGAFAPLAFLWLVIGHFMQQREISANTRAIKLQEQSAQRLELHSRRDNYFKLLSLVQDQLGGIAAFHYMSVCGPTGTGAISAEEFTEQRAISSTGDSAWFVRKMIALAVDHHEDPAAMQDIFFGTEIRRRHAENYCRTFRKLWEEAQSVDNNDMLADALLSGSAQGLLYRVISHVRGDTSVEPFLGTTVAPPTGAAAS